MTVYYGLRIINAIIITWRKLGGLSNQVNKLKVLHPMNMKSIGSIFLTLAASTLLLSACGGKSSSTSEKAVAKQAAEASQPSVTAADQKTVLKAQVDDAKKTTKAFVSVLKGELKAAMKAGGPINALSVCNTKAMPITAQVAKQQGANLSRVSLKNRNPANVPNDWQKKVLEDFDARAARGEDIKTMAFAKIVEQDGKKQFRFMKAMPTGKPCLSCHGSHLAPDVKAKLAELYPEDKATGYELGQVRGAVVITKDL
jgi:hypothetical protein